MRGNVKKRLRKAENSGRAQALLCGKIAVMVQPSIGMGL
jgi:hypothetical protein